MKIIDDNTYAFILNNVKLFNSDKKEELLRFYIDKTIQEINNKTNRNNFPSDLKYLVVDLVNDGIAINKMDNEPSQNQSINSMSEGGRSVNFGIDSYSQNRFNALLQQKLADNEKQINRYKLLYKVVDADAKN